MRKILLIILLASTPHLSARWSTDHSTTVQFTSAGRACLSVRHATGQGVFLGCWDKAGTITLTFGGPETDGNFRPQAGDVYVLVTNGETWQAPLVGRAQYLAVWRG